MIRKIINKASIVEYLKTLRVPLAYPTSRWVYDASEMTFDREINATFVYNTYSMSIKYFSIPLDRLRKFWPDRATLVFCHFDNPIDTVSVKVDDLTEYTLRYRS